MLDFRIVSNTDIAITFDKQGAEILLSALRNTLNNGSFILSLNSIGRSWISEITLVVSEQEHYHFTKNQLLLHMDEESLLYNIERLERTQVIGEFFPPEFYDSFHGGTKRQSLNLYAHFIDSTNTIDLIDFLWNKDQLPLINGLVTSGGLYYPISMDKNMLSFASSFPFEKDTTNYLEYFSYIDITKELLYQGLHVYCGYGSFGGDGFVYVTDEKDDFKWLFFSNYCNPMEMMEVKENKLIVTNNLEQKWIFNLNKPYDMIFEKSDY